jgi:2-oxoglutarate dehydrogenase E2 component (dihydrolipoamide succinyltransferase)
VPDLVVPKLNNNDSSYVVVGWLAGDGDAVAAGDPVAEIETSKSVTDVVCESEGILHQLVPVGAECRPGDVLARVFATEAERRAFAEGADAPRVTDPGEPSDEPALVLTDSARGLADELGVTAAQLRGLGKRVVKLEDVRRLAGGGADGARATGAVAPQRASDAPGDGRLALTRAQRAVGSVVSESHATIPAAFAAIGVSVDGASDLARRITRRSRRLVGIPELLVKAVAGLRDEHPLFFATGYDGTSVMPADGSHVGVTVDVGTGLFIPVVRDAHELSCEEIADEMIDFRTKAMRGGFREPDLNGANIVVSLHNDADVVAAVPIVFPGQTCVVSLAGTRSELALDATGAVVARGVTTIGIAYDHRVVNGREAVRFLQELKRALEDPAPLDEA